MAMADWKLEGEWLKNCNCAFGCPCDFNARPSNGYCKGLVAMNIKKGHFNKTKLDCLKFAVTVDFPGALHEGNGAIQPILDEMNAAAGPPAHELPINEARASHVAETAWLCGEGEPVAEVRDVTVPGPGGAIPMRMRTKS